MELGHLRLADRHIAEGELRITAQLALLERLRNEGGALGPAEELLTLLETTMVLWREHRSLILASLDDSPV